MVQETAYQAYISKDRIKDISKFKSWILKIAVNKSKDLLRRHSPILLEDLSALDSMEMEDNDSLSVFVEDLKGLSINEKNIIVFKIYFQYTFEMISQEIRIPVSTIKSSYYRALEKLKCKEGLYD